MTVEQIKETDTLNQGRIKINAIMEQSNAATEKVNSYQEEIIEGINEAKEIAENAGEEAVNVATKAGEQANELANQALSNSQTAINTANQAVSTANNNKQEFDALRNDFDQLVAESGDSNPEIVQARTDTQGVKRATLATRLQIDFGDRMTKAEGISLFTGSTNVKKMMDFTGKTAGNTAVNPHKYFTDFTAKTLKKPSDVWNEVSQAVYNKITTRDDSGILIGSTQSGVIPQQMAVFDVAEEVKKLTPQIYEGLSRTEIAEAVKASFLSFTVSVRAKAVSPNNKNVKVAAYVESVDSYTTQIQERAEAFTDFTVQINDSSYLTSDAFVYLMIYTDASNGVSSSSVETDYCGVQLELSVNAQNILDSSGYAKQTDIAAAIAENVTKEKIGLSNVNNFGVATQSEAQAGRADDKYMTPLRTSQTIRAMILEVVYPIGSIYSSVSNQDPAAIFGGIWERIKGKVLVSVDEEDPDFDTAGKIGGNKTHNHTLGNGFAKVQLTGATLAVFGKKVPKYKAQNKASSFSGVASPNTDLEWGAELGGTTDAEDNMPPYKTVYMWERIA